MSGVKKDIFIYSSDLGEKKKINEILVIGRQLRKKRKILRTSIRERSKKQNPF